MLPSRRLSANLAPVPTFTEMLKTQVNLEKSVLNAEHDQERMAYQRLVQENARLEQRNETLERELQRARGGRTHQVSRQGAAGRTR